MIFIYASIPLARKVQAFLANSGGRGIFLGITLLFLAILASRVALLFARNRRRVYPWGVPVIAAVSGAYWFLLHSVIVAPEEAFHLVQYGILSLILLQTLKEYSKDAAIFLSAALLTVIAGIMDELIQWATPNRFFDYRDIGLNALAGLLTLAAASVFKPASNYTPVSAKSFKLPLVLVMVLLVVFSGMSAATPAFMNRAADITGIGFFRNNPSVITEYGYRHMLGNITFFSRLLKEDLLNEDRQNADQYSLLLKEQGPDYVKFLSLFPGAEHPFLHEFRIHLFRRDQYLAHYLAENNPVNTCSHAGIALHEEIIIREYFKNTASLADLLLDNAIFNELSRCSMGKPYVSPVSSHLVTINPMIPRIIMLLVLLASMVLLWRIKKGTAGE